MLKMPFFGPLNTDVGLCFQEGYWDCELALRFNYPMKNRDKLYERKFILAGHVESKLEETLREMEEMVENEILTERQLKCEFCELVR